MRWCGEARSICTARRRLVHHGSERLVFLSALVAFWICWLVLVTRALRARDCADLPAPPTTIREAWVPACMSSVPCSCSSTRVHRDRTALARLAHAPGEPACRPVRQTRLVREYLLPMRGSHRRALRAARADRQRRHVGVYKAHDRLLYRQISVKIRHPHFTRTRITRAVPAGGARRRAAPPPEHRHRLDRVRTRAAYLVLEYVEG